MNRLLCIAAALPLLLAFAAPGSIGAEQAYLEYVLQTGDTLSTVSQRYLTTTRYWPRLQRLNGISGDRQLRPGDKIRIPVEWLKSGSAEVVAIRGEARLEREGGSVNLERGMKIGVSDRIKTGADASLTLGFSDSSTVTVQKDSNVAVTLMRELAGTVMLAHRIHVDAGRIESSVTPGKTPGSRFEIQTPFTVFEVRGTDFRVAVDKVTRSEVLKGVVEVGAEPGKGVEVAEGYGTVVDASRRPTAPIALLPAPDVSMIAPLQERPELRLAFGAVAGAQSYRALVSTDPAFETVVTEAIIAEPPVQFRNLPDGEYRVRVRAIHATGLEGRDGQTRFRLNSRPRPPVITSPSESSKIRATGVEFSWRAAAEAATYHLQLAANPDFRLIVREATGISGLSHRLNGIPFFDYYWRIASVRANGDHGPWSETQTLALRPPPTDPEAAVVADKALRFSWWGEPDQKFLVQLARDLEFRDVVSENRLDTPELALPRPGRGVYFMRYQATDPDGFVGPFSAAQRVEVP